MPNSKFDYLILVFAKPPIPGQVKSRLAIFTGIDTACNIYATMLENLTGELYKNSLPFEIWSASKKNKKSFEKYLNTNNKIYNQNGSDLGEKMSHAFIKSAKRNSGKNIILCGTDIPDLKAGLLLKAAATLSHNDIVVGPTFDGGYYLIGLNSKILKTPSVIRAIFSNLKWSHKNVFNDQIKRIQSLGLSFSSIKKLQDLDYINDFINLKSSQKKKLSRLLPDIRVIIPVLNEEKNLEYILKPLFETGLFREIICADNGSSDNSPGIASRLGARVTHCSKKGYGATCLKAIEDINNRGGCDVILFMDGDGSDNSMDITTVLGPVTSGDYDLCIGMRQSNLAQKGSLKHHQIFGNKLSVFLIYLFYGYRFSDLGPMRAIQFRSLQDLQMDDQNFGWTIQMQIRSVKHQQKIIEVPVHYRTRYAGKSKVTATIAGSIKAGIIILKTVIKERFFSK